MDGPEQDVRDAARWLARRLVALAENETIQLQDRRRVVRDCEAAMDELEEQ